MFEERKIRAYKTYFKNFIESLSEFEARKVFYVIDMLKTQERLSRKFVKHIEDGIFELRAEYNGNGFKKKTQKTPLNEIEQAKKLKQEYYNEKGK